MREKPYYTLMIPGELEEGRGGERREEEREGNKKTEPERQRKRRYKRV